MSIKEQLEQLVEARRIRQAQKAATLDRLLGLLTPEEASAVAKAIEADLEGRQAPLDVQKRADRAFSRVWAAATPEEQQLLICNTL